jgi:hypothetical protein
MIMRAGRYYDSAGGAQAARWPFAIHEVRVTPPIAPEFQASFEKILTTTRYYFDIQRDRRESRKRGTSRP